MATTPCTPDFERALVLLLSATPRSISDNPRLSSLFHEFLEDFFQRCTPEELSHFVPMSVRTALGSQQPSAASADSPGSVCSRGMPATALGPLHSGGPLPVASSAGFSNNKLAEIELGSVPSKSGKRPAPESPIPPSSNGAKARKKTRTESTFKSFCKARKEPRTEPCSTNVKKAAESLIGVDDLRRFSTSSIWGSPIWRSSIVDELRFEPSVHTDNWGIEIELPLKRYGEVWKRNKAKMHESECARRFLGLFIIHVADYCESLPEIPRPRRRGCSKRTLAYEMVTLATGESASDIARIVAASKRYLRLAKEAGLSRLLEIDSKKSWVWEKLLTEIDVTAVCTELRNQHKSMSEEEKKYRSECDFLAAREIIIMLEGLGKTASKLVEVETELTKVLRRFVDFESLCKGRIDPTGGDFYGGELSEDTALSSSSSQSSQMIENITYEDQMLRCGSTLSGEKTRASEGDSEVSSIIPAQAASQASDPLSDSGQQHPSQSPRQRVSDVDGLDALLLAADADLSHSNDPLNNTSASDMLWDSSTPTNTAHSQRQPDMQIVENHRERTPDFNMMHSYSLKDSLQRGTNANTHQNHIEKPRVNALCYNLELESPASNTQEGPNVHESSIPHVSPTSSQWANTAPEPHQTISSEVGTSLSNNQYQELSTSGWWDPFDFWPDGVENTISAMEDW